MGCGVSKDTEEGRGVGCGSAEIGEGIVEGEVSMGKVVEEDGIDVGILGLREEGRDEDGGELPMKGKVIFGKRQCVNRGGEEDKVEDGKAKKVASLKTTLC